MYEGGSVRTPFLSASTPPLPSSDQLQEARERITGLKKIIRTAKDGFKHLSHWMTDGDRLVGKTYGGPQSRYLHSNGTTLGELAFTGAITTVALEALGFISSVAQIVGSVFRIRVARQLKKMGGAQRKLGNYKFNSGLTDLSAGSAGFIASAGATIRAGAAFGAHLTGGSALATSMIHIGTYIAGPVGFALSAVGAVKNYSNIKHSSERLNLVNELIQLENEKYEKMSDAEQNAYNKTYEEKQKILSYAKRKLGYKLVNNKISLAQNCAVGTGAALTTISVAVGPGAAFLSTLGVGIAIGGTVISLGIRGAVLFRRRIRRKALIKESQRRQALRDSGQIHDKIETYQRTKDILSLGKKIMSNHTGELDYKSTKKEEWSPAQLLAFLVTPGKGATKEQARMGSKKLWANEIKELFEEHGDDLLEEAFV